MIEKHFAWRFFTSGDSREPELAGLRGAIVGSLLTLIMTLSLSVPLGIAAAVYLEEFAAKNKWTEVIEVNINNLAAVPSIIFGLLGLAVFINFFGLPRSAPLVGGLVLALLVLPTIIIASRAALKAVPPSIKEAALGVGASHQQAVFHHVLPLAMPGILTGTILGVARALGETAPLLMIGMVAFIVDIPKGLHRSCNRIAGANLSLVGPAGSRLPVAHGGGHHCSSRHSLLPQCRRHLPAQALRAALVGLRKTSWMLRPRNLPCPTTPAFLAERETKIVASDVNVYYGDKHAIKHLSIDIPDRAVSAFIGPSGCGKSTFLRSINRMNDTIDGCRVTGDILVDGKNIYDRDLDVVQLRARVGMVFQKPNPFPKSIFENVAYGPRIHGIAKSKTDLEEIVVNSLKKASLFEEVKDRLDHPGTGLSGGQQQRLCIARAIAVNPEIILMDEPCSALDPIASARIEELIDEIRQNYCIIIVTHSMQQAARVSQLTAFFHLGDLVEFGDTDDMFTTPQDKRTQDYITGRFG